MNSSCCPRTDPRSHACIAGGRDFYSNPRISRDGTRLCFLAWNLPWMPWDGCELHVADLAPNGDLSDIEHVAGADGSESIWQPEWSPTGDLVFASDRSGWWNLERIRGDERTALHTAHAEFGYPAWSFGASSYAFLDDERIVCAFDSDGFTHFGVLDSETRLLSELDLSLDSLSGSPFVRAEGGYAVIVAGTTTTPNGIVLVDVDAESSTTLQTSSAVALAASTISAARPIDFETESGLTAHALFYAPASEGFEAPDGELPPLIVESHGGPTGNATGLFGLGVQFWTSRGFAVVDVNYGGSTGYGRAYRERLNGQWGVVDLADCLNAARHLVEQGEADPDRLLITGGALAATRRSVRSRSRTRSPRDRRTSASPTSSSSEEARPTSSSCSTSTRSWGRIRSGRISIGRAAPSTSPIGSRRPCWCCKGRMSCRPTVSGGADRRGSPRAQRPACVSPVRGRGSRLPQGGEHCGLARGRALVLRAGTRL